MPSSCSSLPGLNLNGMSDQSTAPSYLSNQRKISDAESNVSGENRGENMQILNFFSFIEVIALFFLSAWDKGSAAELP